MRTRHLAPLLLLAPALAGCLVLRGGGGVTAESARDDRGRRLGPGRFDAELGLVLPVEARERAWLLSALLVHRAPRAGDVGWSLAALEVARPLHPLDRGRPGLDRSLGWTLPAGLRDLGLRVEAGRSERGGYAGGAAKATLRLAGSWTLTGVLSAGVNTGPDHGPSAGLHLLVGWN